MDEGEKAVRVFLVPEGGLEPPHEFNPVADFKSAVSAISPLWRNVNQQFRR